MSGEQFTPLDRSDLKRRAFLDLSVVLAVALVDSALTGGSSSKAANGVSGQVEAETDTQNQEEYTAGPIAVGGMFLGAGTAATVMLRNLKDAEGCLDKVKVVAAAGTMSIIGAGVGYGFGYLVEKTLESDINSTR